MKDSREKGEIRASILEDFSYFPHAFDPQTGNFQFYKTNRKALSEASFLDGRVPFWENNQISTVPGREVQNWVNDQKSPSLNVLFHSGFCCSTLLARLLDIEGELLALKEPNLLNYFSETRHFSFSGKTRKDFLKNLDLSLALLARTRPPGEDVLLKASNVDSVLLEDIKVLYPGVKMVFLFSDLKTFLISVAKGGPPRRSFTRRLFAHYLADFKTRDKYNPNLFGPGEDYIWKLSDLHIAAGAWILQMRCARETCGRNVFWLNPEDFLGDPKKTLDRVQNFLGASQKKQVWRKRDIEKTLLVHAKAPNFQYNPQKRKTDIQAIENYLSPVLPEVLEWAEKIFPLGENNKPQKIAV